MKWIRNCKQGLAFLIILMVSAGWMAGCAGDSTSVRKETVRDAEGDTDTVVVKETTTTDDDPGLIGSIFHVIGEILAFPFEVIAQTFRFIF